MLFIFHILHLVSQVPAAITTTTTTIIATAVRYANSVRITAHVVIGIVEVTLVSTINHYLFLYSLHYCNSNFMA